MTRLVRAPNPGPMTLEGTNTWLVGRARVLLVDPGPDDDAHLRAVLDEVARDGGVLGGVLLTHRHHDHAEALGSPRLRDAVAAHAAPVLALDASLGAPPEERVLAEATDEPVRVLPLPGHTDDSLGLVLPRRREVLTGDTVLGRGTSVVAHPDGHLGAYLASLGRLRALVAGPVGGPADGDGRPWRGLPGHGPVLDDLGAALEVLHAHRLARVEQVRSALAGSGFPPSAGGSHDPDLVEAVVAAVYPEVVDPALREAAARTVRATLVHLAEGPGTDDA